MEGVSFEEEQSTTRYSASPARASGLVGFLTRTRFVENERQAIAWLIGIAVLAAVLAVAIFLYFTGERGTLSPAERAQLEKTIQIPPYRR